MQELETVNGVIQT